MVRFQKIVNHQLFIAEIIHLTILLSVPIILSIIKYLHLTAIFPTKSEEEIFRPNSKALNELSNNIKSYGMDLSTNSIYNAYNLLIHKKDSFSQRWIIVDSEGGAIQNENLQYNGMYYLRRIVEKNEEIVEESICVKML